MGYKKVSPGPQKSHGLKIPALKFVTKTHLRKKNIFFHVDKGFRKNLVALVFVERDSAVSGY